MQVVLVMFRADGDRKSFSVTRDITVIGRREDCDFRIPLGDISRKHCRLIREDETLRVEDLGSSNGTYVNGKRIQDAVLQPGDTVQFGPVVFVVQMDGVPADDELKPYSPPAHKDDSSAGTKPSVAISDDAETTSSSGMEVEGDFDPMSVLEGSVDSDIMPALPDSAINEDVMLDMSDSHQNRAE